MSSQFYKVSFDSKFSSNYEITCCFQSCTPYWCLYKLKEILKLDSNFFRLYCAGSWRKLSNYYNCIILNGSKFSQNNCKEKNTIKNTWIFQILYCKNRTFQSSPQMAISSSQDKWSHALFYTIINKLDSISSLNFSMKYNIV